MDARIWKTSIFEIETLVAFHRRTRNSARADGTWEILFALWKLPKKKCHSGASADGNFTMVISRRHLAVSYDIWRGRGCVAARIWWGKINMGAGRGWDVAAPPSAPGRRPRPEATLRRPIYAGTSTDQFHPDGHVRTGLRIGQTTTQRALLTPNAWLIAMNWSDGVRGVARGRISGYVRRGDGSYWRFDRFVLRGNSIYSVVAVYMHGGQFDADKLHVRAATSRLEECLKYGNITTSAYDFLDILIVN